MKAKRWNEVEHHLASNYVLVTPQEGRLDKAAAFAHLQQLQLDDFTLGDLADRVEHRHSGRDLCHYHARQVRGPARAHGPSPHDDGLAKAKSRVDGDCSFRPGGRESRNRRRSSRLPLVNVHAKTIAMNSDQQAAARRQRQTSLATAPAGLVRPQRARPTLAPRSRSLPRVAFGNHVAADPRGCGAGALPPFSAALSDSAETGSGARIVGAGGVERPGILPPRPHDACRGQRRS